MVNGGNRDVGGFGSITMGFAFTSLRSRTMRTLRAAAHTPFLINIARWFVCLRVLRMRARDTTAQHFAAA